MTGRADANFSNDITKLADCNFHRLNYNARTEAVMWDKAKKILGYVWASPVTAVGLTYAGLFHVLGWYNWHGRRDDALVWRVSASAPGALKHLWDGWDGHAVGNVIVLNCDPSMKPKQLTHEMAHTRQTMRLGIFHPIIYGINYLAIRAGCGSSHPYWSNPFEIDARRAAGQLVDVEGAINRLKGK